jgi:hypothetical protein
LTKKESDAQRRYWHEVSVGEVSNILAPWWQREVAIRE